MSAVTAPRPQTTKTMRLPSLARARRAGAAAGLVLAAGALLGACSNDSLLGLNNNPNNPTDAPAGPLFTNAVNSTVSRFRGSNFDFTGTSLFAQHFAKVQYVDEDQYRIRAANINNAFFLPAYSGELEDLRKVRQKGQEGAAPATTAAAAVMQTWTFGILTDSFGDIPYSQALLGDTTGASFTPAYDPQQQIYRGFFTELAAASTSLTGASNSLGAADPVFGGDPARWQKFANSLRARFALRQIKADAAGTNTQLTAAFAAPGGVMTSNADNAQVVWPGDGINDNPYAANFRQRDDNRMSKVLVDTLNAYADPRLPVYAQPTAADPTVYAGLQNGLSTPNAAPFFNTTSRPGAIFYSGTTAYGTFGNASNARTPSYLMTYAEVAFIQAEAAARGIGGLSAGQAQGFYEAGVRASMGQWGITNSAAVTAYLAQPGVAYVAGAEGLRRIALYTQGSEAWSEYRRTGVPALIPAPARPASITGVPRRLPYPTNEQSINSASRAAAVERQGADTYNTRVWWDRP